MELPHIGEHCSYHGCNKLDYLPIQCEVCKNKFCNEHHKYEAHSCAESHRIDVQVPICPLCDNPVPFKRNEAPDIAVNDHIMNNCKHKQKKIYTNKCKHQGCKAKELVSINCSSCQQNFCLRHRNPIDHDCKGDPAATRREQTLNGSIFHKLSFRNKQPKETQIPKLRTVQPSPPPRVVNFSNLQGNYNEDEALARALRASSLENPQGHTSQSVPTPDDAEDLALAQAIAASMQDEDNKNRKSKDSCTLS